MSHEAINDFFKHLDENAALSSEFDKITGGDTYKDQLLALAKKYGYDFTMEELDHVIAEAKRIKDNQ